MTTGAVMPSDTDHDSLVAQLRELGVCYLTPTDARVDETRRYTAPELIGRLASHPDPRLRHALIAVLIRHPELADEVRKLIDVLDPAARVELMAHYMAAVYLQRMWHTRLGFYLDVQLLPDLFSSELGLPSPEERHGKTGLHATAQWHAQRSPYPFNTLSSYYHVMDLLFAQLKQEARRHEPA